MHVFRNVRVVDNFYGDAPALSHPQQRTGDSIAVADRADYNLRGELDHRGCDLQGEIGPVPAGRQGRRHKILWRPRALAEWRRGRLREGGPQYICPRRDQGGTSKPHKIPSVHAIFIPVANAEAKANLPRERCCYENRPRTFGFYPSPLELWLIVREKRETLTASTLDVQRVGRGLVDRVEEETALAGRSLSARLRREGSAGGNQSEGS
jgi:hypothetical protein